MVVIDFLHIIFYRNFDNAARSRRTTKLTRRRKRSDEMRHERRSEAVGGRVQRLVVWLLTQVAADYSPANNSTKNVEAISINTPSMTMRFFETPVAN